MSHQSFSCYTSETPTMTVICRTSLQGWASEKFHRDQTRAPRGHSMPEQQRRAELMGWVSHLECLICTPVWKTVAVRLRTISEILSQNLVFCNGRVIEGRPVMTFPSVVSEELPLLRRRRISNVGYVGFNVKALADWCLLPADPLRAVHWLIQRSWSLRLSVTINSFLSYLILALNRNTMTWGCCIYV